MGIRTRRRSRLLVLSVGGNPTTPNHVTPLCNNEGVHLLEKEIMDTDTLTPIAQAHTIWVTYGHNEAVMLAILTQLITNIEALDRQVKEAK